MATGVVSSVTTLLKYHFQRVAQQNFKWLYELLDIGSTYEEIATLLIAGEIASPWIPQKTETNLIHRPAKSFHQKNCVHKGGLRIENTPHIRSRGLPNVAVIRKTGISEIRDSVSQNCGLAGVLLTDIELDAWRAERSCISFTGDHNSIAWIRNHRNKEGILRHMVDALERCLSAIWILQTAGMCCDYC